MDSRLARRTRPQHPNTLTAQIEAVFAHGTRVVVDLTTASFVDSTTIGVLLHGYQQSQAKAGDALVVVATPNSQPRRVFDLVGLHDLLPTFQTRQGDLAAITP